MCICIIFHTFHAKKQDNSSDHVIVVTSSTSVGLLQCLDEPMWVASTQDKKKK